MSNRLAWLCCCAALAVTGGITGVAPADVVHSYTDDSLWSYRVYHVPDIDQKRQGLIVDGSMHCVPTATLDMLAYIAANGFPGTWPGPRPYYWYANSANHEQITGQLGLLGFIMGTDEDGTNIDGGLAGLRSSLDGGFIYGHYTAAYSDFSIYMPTLDSMAPYAGSRALMQMTVGWYDDDGRDGGHRVMVTEIIRDGSFRLVGFRDPATDENPDMLTAQSLFRRSRFFTQVEEVEVFPDIVFSSEKVVGMTSGDKVGLIDGVTFVIPAVAWSANSTLSTLRVILPDSYAWDADHEVYRDFATTAQGLIRGVELDPRTLTPYFITGGVPGAEPTMLWRLDPSSLEQDPLVTFDDVTEIAIDRFGIVWVLDNAFQVRGFDVSGQHAELMRSWDNLFPLTDMALDDLSDRMYMLVPSTRWLMVLDTRNWNYLGHTVLPASVGLNGQLDMAVDPTDGNVWISSNQSSTVARVTPVLGGDALATTMPHGLSQVRAIQLDDLGRPHLVSNNTIRVFDRVGAVLVPNAGTPFAGLSASSAISVGRSRTNFDPDRMTGPAWRNVLPDNVDYGDPDCYADITGPADLPDGTVNVIDLLYMLSDWGESDSFADVYPDGQVDVADLLVVLSAWGACE